MDPTTWAWIAVVVALVVIAPPLGMTRLRSDLWVPACAAVGVAILAASAGRLLIADWSLAVGLACVFGAGAGVLAEIIAGRSSLFDRPGLQAGNLAAASYGVGLLAIALGRLLLADDPAPGLALAALALGAAVTAAVFRLASIGGNPRAPAAELAALVVIAAVAAGSLTTEATTAALPLAVLALGGVGALAGRGFRAGDPAVMLQSRSRLGTAVVAAGGPLLMLASAPAGISRPIGLGIAITVGAVGAAAVTQLAELYTADRWRPAKRLATRAKSGPAAVIATAIGDAARATGWLLGGIVAAAIAAERAGRLAGDGSLGVALAVVAAVATLGVNASGEFLSVLARQGDDAVANADPVAGEAAAHLLAAGSAAGAVGRSVATFGGGAVGLLLIAVLANHAPSGVATGWGVAGFGIGVAVAWYAAGWTSHAHEPGSVLSRTGRALLVVAISMAAPAGLGTVSAAAGWGLVAGLAAAALALSFALVIASGAWDNTRRLIEAGAYGGTGSRAHRAIVAADTIGVRWRDAVAPSVVVLLLVAAVTAIAFASLMG